MCGIVGFVNDKDNKKTIINTMMDRIVHRGPNSSGEYIDKHVALGFRRLSIIDLEGGTQPIYNEDRTKIIIFNGEIYNYQPLREELIAAGHVFLNTCRYRSPFAWLRRMGNRIIAKNPRNVCFCYLG